MLRFVAENFFPKKREQNTRKLHLINSLRANCAQFHKVVTANWMNIITFLKRDEVNGKNFVEQEQIFGKISFSCTPHANLLKTFHLSEEIDSDLVETFVVWKIYILLT